MAFARLFGKKKHVELKEAVEKNQKSSDPLAMQTAANPLYQPITVETQQAPKNPKS